MDVEEGSEIGENVVETGSTLEMNLEEKVKKLRNAQAEINAKFDRDILALEIALGVAKDSSA